MRQVDDYEMLHFVTNDEFTICHNRMDFPQEIGTQHDKSMIFLKEP